jgi:uncharacterized membrane protein
VHYNGTIVKYVATVISFLLMWFFVTFLCIFLVTTFFPAGVRVSGTTISSDGSIYLSMILGVLAGAHSARATLNPKRNEDAGSNTPK